MIRSDWTSELLDYADMIGPGGSGLRRPAESAFGQGDDTETDNSNEPSLDEGPMIDGGTSEGESSSSSSRCRGVVDEDGLIRPAKADEQVCVVKSAIIAHRSSLIAHRSS